jgi:hypothetical protein
LLALERDVHLGKAAGRGRDHGGCDFIEMQFHERPLLVCEDDERDFPAYKVLLVTDIFVGAEKHFVPTPLVPPVESDRHFSVRARRSAAHK